MSPTAKKTRKGLRPAKVISDNKRVSSVTASAVVELFLLFYGDCGEIKEDSQLGFKRFFFQKNVKTERISEPDRDHSQLYQSVDELFPESSTPRPQLALVENIAKRPRGRPPGTFKNKARMQAQNAQNEEFKPQNDAKGSLKLCFGGS